MAVPLLLRSASSSMRWVSSSRSGCPPSPRESSTSSWSSVDSLVVLAAVGLLDMTHAVAIRDALQRLPVLALGAQHHDLVSLLAINVHQAGFPVLPPARWAAARTSRIWRAPSVPASSRMMRLWASKLTLPRPMSLIQPVIARPFPGPPWPSVVGQRVA